MIDQQRWDDCIAQSLNRRIYAFSWYLDMVCPGWDALIGGDYETVFPLTWNRKWSVKYLYQPYFTQQLGVFSINPISTELVSAFLKAIPVEIKFAEIQLNAMNGLPIPGWNMKNRINHELSLDSTYQEIAGKYSQNTKRNLKKAAEARVFIGNQPSINDLIDLFRTNFGDREGKLKPKNYRIINNLLTYFKHHGIGAPMGIYSAQNKLSSAAFFVQDQSRIYFLFAASSPQARENGAMFYLIDRFIANHAGKPIILDFEGGNDPQLGRFYKSFGACEVSYPAMTMNRLPSMALMALNIARKLTNS
ncbi:MAG: hypothetical protein NT004_05035 [Bacteroidetes bacterium]|nr:hypothetical protein [Bacteroidota bacterium]